MPRARLSDHLKEQASWDSSLLKLPVVTAIAEAIRDRTKRQQAISAKDLGALLKVPPRSLAELGAQRAGSTPTGVRSEFGERMAIAALGGYLPKVLGWKSVSDFADELGLHRNTVESLVRSFGDPQNLMYALDHRLYISPDGEKVVLRKTEELRSFGDRFQLSHFARQIGVKVNILTAYFSSRKIALQRDPLGRVRLTEDQKKEILSWREQVAKRRSHDDLLIQGESFKSIAKIAREKASVLAAPGSERHEQLVRREERTLRFLAREGNFATKTSIGTYVSSLYADRFLGVISLSQAARLVAVSATTIKEWRNRYPVLRPEPLPGKKTQGVALSGLITIAERKYSEEPKLRARPKVPAVFAAQAVQLMADELGVHFKDLLDALKVTGEPRLSLENKSGVISREWHHRLIDLVATNKRALGESLVRDGAPQSPTEGFLALNPEELLLTPRAALNLIERVAATRNVPAERLYSFITGVLRLTSSWPTSYQELIQTVSKGGECAQFPVSYATLLSLLSRSERRVYIYGKSVREPNSGDIFVHPGTSDFGLVIRCEYLHGCKVARVSLVRRGEPVTFGLSPD